MGAGYHAETLVRAFPAGVARVTVVSWTSSWMAALVPVPPETMTYGCVEVNRLLAIAAPAQGERPRRYPPLFVKDMGCGELRFSPDPLLTSATVTGTVRSMALDGANNETRSSTIRVDLTFTGTGPYALSAELTQPSVDEPFSQEAELMRRATATGTVRSRFVGAITGTDDHAELGVAARASHF